MKMEQMTEVKDYIVEAWFESGNIRREPYGSAWEAMAAAEELRHAFGLLRLTITKQTIIRETINLGVA